MPKKEFELFKVRSAPFPMDFCSEFSNLILTPLSFLSSYISYLVMCLPDVIQASVWFINARPLCSFLEKF